MMPATAEEEHDCRLELSLHSYNTTTLTTLGGGAESDVPDHASKIQNNLEMISLSWHHHHHRTHTHRHSPTLSSSLYASAKSQAANDEEDVACQNSNSDKPQIRFHDYLSAAAGAGAGARTGTGGDGDRAGSLYRWISAGAGEQKPVGVGGTIWFNHNSAPKPQAQAQSQSQSPEIHVMDINFASTTASVASSSSCRNIARFCVDCKTSKTPLWRSGPQGPKSLCNACGIRYRKARRALAALGDSHSHSHTNTASSSVTKRKSHSAEAKLQHNKRSKILLPESWRSTPTSWRKINKSPLLLGDKEAQVDGSNPSAAAAAAARFKRVFAKDEDEEAAVLLMAMSCGRLVHV